MLRHLRVREFAIFEDLALDLEPGLNVFTGETGAGKSLVVDALTFLVGRRADISFIREGAERAVLEAVVEAPDSGWIDARLDERGLEPTEDGALTLRRELKRDGGGRAFVNGSPVPLAGMREIASSLFEIHAQHEAQRLFDVEWHRRWVDRFGGHSDALRTVAEAADAAVEADRAHTAFLDLMRDAEGRREALARTVGEIEAVEPVPGEREALDRERSRLKHSKEWMSGVAGALEALAETDGAAIPAALEAAKALSRLAPIEEAFGGLADRVESARLELEDVAETLAAQRAGFEYEPGRLETVESRRAALDELCLRYGPNLEDVLAALEDAKTGLAELGRGGGRATELHDAVEAARARWIDRAGTLKRARRRALPGVKKALAVELEALAMGGASFEVAFEEPRGGTVLASLPEAPRVHVQGSETLRFRLSANPGEPARPLDKVASGGELSRVMLSLHLALGGETRRTLVFDEIDAGVGGAVADALGARLARLAAGHQVIVVTHQPQVAAHGDHHYHVSKAVDGGRTRAGAAALDVDERTDELARMLGGESVTEASRENARALREAAG
ncbi:MAG: DNA repair protein RecN, partial [Planctomycetota bacterium]|nr:DNA repair protein RecN [Planctomycetota bacterium]